MSLPDVPSQLEKVPKAVTAYDKQIGRYFGVARQGSELYQSEYALDSAGEVLFRHTEKIVFVVGTGANGFSYLVQRGDYLFQAPLSFYSRTRSWDLSPAHEMGFDRPIVTGCIVCHSGQPQPVANRNGLYQQPPFKELAIGCERCHGPGQLHVEARTKGTPPSAGADLSIVSGSAAELARRQRLHAVSRAGRRKGVAIRKGLPRLSSGNPAQRDGGDL